MVKMVPPTYASLNMQLIKSYSPPEDSVYIWYTPRGKQDSLAEIAKQQKVPVEKLIEFNFPGSVKAGRIDTAVVNWYLHHHVRTLCRNVTTDGNNYMFKGGEKIAIPFMGRVDIGSPVIVTPSDKHTKFKIKQHANLNASAVAAVDFSIFQIWDEKAAKCCFYTFWAAGVSGSVTPGWLSATLKGPWNDFEVTIAIAVNQFGGPTRFTTGGFGNHTKNVINFMGLPNGSRTEPNPLQISTGFTIGIGAGTSVGDLKLELVGTTDGLLPFKGD